MSKFWLERQILASKANELVLAKQERSLAILQALVEAQPQVRRLHLTSVEQDSTLLPVIAASTDVGRYEDQNLVAIDGSLLLIKDAEEIFEDLENDPRPRLYVDVVDEPYKVLMLKALGCDALSLWVDQHDQGALQFLIEICRDYHIEPVLVCTSAEALQLALATDVPYIGWVIDTEAQDLGWIGPLPSQLKHRNIWALGNQLSVDVVAQALELGFDRLLQIEHLDLLTSIARQAKRSVASHGDRKSFSDYLEDLE